MKIVVIGGSGLIGSKLVNDLAAHGHDAVAASPSTGVDAVTGEGLAEALEGAQVVVDVANAPDWEDTAVMQFFQTSSRNLLAAEQAAGVGHHVALSIVNTDRLPDIGFFRAKAAQEELVKGHGVPYTILRATQFFEFVGAIADSATEGDKVRLPCALFQPVAAGDVAAVLAEIATGTPLGGTVELAGPEALPMAEFARLLLAGKGDAGEVIADPQARYFGALLDDGSLTPGDDPRMGEIRFAEWLDRATTNA